MGFRGAAALAAAQFNAAFHPRGYAGEFTITGAKKVAAQRNKVISKAIKAASKVKVKGKKQKLGKDNSVAKNKLAPKKSRQAGSGYAGLYIG